MDSLVVTMGEAIAHALREEKAFLRPFVALQKDVAERGRDPAVLILPEKSKASSEDATPERFPLEKPALGALPYENCSRLFSRGDAERSLIVKSRAKEKGVE